VFLCKQLCIIAKRDTAFIQNVMLFHTKHVPKRAKTTLSFTKMRIQNRVKEIIEGKFGLRPTITKTKLRELQQAIGDDFTINRYNQIINNKGEVMDSRELMAFSNWLEEPIDKLTYIKEEQS
jgi:hypothetical protein